MNRRTFLGLFAQQTQTAGFAERDITPWIGSEQPGNYYKRFNPSVHDPCKVRAAVFDDGASRVAIVGVDALMVPRSLVEAARARCAMPVMIAASHSHSGGPLGMVQPGEYDQASPEARALAKLSSEADPKYLKQVEDAIVAAVAAADQGRVPSAWGFGEGREDKVLFNRRFRMKNGLTYTHPRAGNPRHRNSCRPH